MGQQQLLLLVLGIVIVGLAVVVGIQAFGENQKKANQDAMVNDGIRIASDAQAWVLKPTAFGGGNNDPAGVDFQKLGYTDAAGPYENVNGTYTITSDATSVTIAGANSANSTHTRVDVFGPSVDCVATQTAAATIGTAGVPKKSDCSW